MKRKLREVCNFYSGTGFPVKYQGETNGELPFYKVGDIANNAVVGNVYLSLCNNYISHAVADEIRGTIIPANVVVFAKIGEALKLNRRAITSCECLIDNNAMGIGGKPEYLDSKFFYFFMKNLKMEVLAESTTVPSVRKTKLEEVEIEVPPLDKQAEMVVVLSTLQKIISERQEQLIKCDELIKARFVELFGNPSINPYGFLSIPVQEAIESGYIEKPLDGNHGNKHPKSSEYVEEGIPFVMANDLVNGRVDFKKCAKLTKERADQLDKGFAHDGDVLITHKGTIGRTAILHTDLDYVMLTPQVTYYRPLKGILAEYLKGYFDSEYFQHKMKQLAEAGGSTRAYVGITNQTQLSLLIPDLDRQKEFVEFIKQVDKSKVVIQKSLDEAQLLFDSLMQLYFS